jgi:hypothetical protein
MAVMVVDVPEGRTVHVIVGDIHPTGPATAPIVDGHAVPARRRPMLMMTAGVCILVVGFVLGHRTIASHAEADQPVASASIPAPPQAGLADNEQASGTAAGPAAVEPPAGNQVPTAFTQQLNAPPQVTPAPGAPPGGSAPAKNPFGLGG